MYKLLAIAGTFDHLHKGHRFFISQAFKLGEKIIIGLTSNEFARKKLSVEAESGKDTSDGVPQALLRGGGINKKLKIQNYQDREKELKNFLESEGLLNRSEIVKIDDIYGPAIERNDIEALAVTKETFEGARKVNEKRRELGFRPLKVLTIPLILADDRKRIASTRVRLGEIDRWGRVFRSKIKDQRSKISERLRQELKKPQGNLIKGDPENHKLVVPKLRNLIRKLNPVMISTIGDEVTKLCNQIGIEPNLAIFDYKVNRKKKYYSLTELGFLKSYALKTPQGWQVENLKTHREWPAYKNSPGVERSRKPLPVEKSVIRVRNPAGNITRSLVKKVAQKVKRIILTGEEQIIRVLGEDDLSAVPAILLSPLGSVVLYGQPGEGIVLVEVTEEKKEKLLKLISNLTGH